MNLLNKNNSKKEESLIIRLWNNKRTHAALVLTLWFIFLLLVFALCFAGTEENKSTNTNDDTSIKTSFNNYDKMQDNLKNNNYAYEYNLKSENSLIKYSGSKDGLTDIGYKQTNSETIKYYVDKTGLYKVVLNDLESYDRLYEGVFEQFLEPSDIFDIIKDLSFTTIEDNNTRTYSYSYLKDETTYSIEIITDINNITQINIKSDVIDYNLKFSSINNISNNNLEYNK